MIRYFAFCRLKLHCYKKIAHSSRHNIGENLFKGQIAYLCYRIERL